MKRRDFIKGAAATVATGAVTACATPTDTPVSLDNNTASESTLYDVIVVGAGFAGLTASRDLSKNDHNVLMLDARGRIGGRTFTTQFADHQTDMGGTWFGSGQPSLWAEKMRYDLEVEESAAAASEEIIWFEKGKPVTGTPDDYWGMMVPAYDQFYAPSRAQYPHPFDPLKVADTDQLDQKSAGEVIDSLDLNPLQKELFHAFACINGHSNSYNSSYLDQLRWVALGGHDKWVMWDNISRFKFKGGTKVLADKIQADNRATTKLGSAAVKVSQRDGVVTVTTNRKEQFKAKQVVMAVPLNTCKDIEFSPALSAIKTSAFNEGHTGSGTKIYAKVKGKFPKFFGNGTQDMPLCFLWTEYDSPDEADQVLCGFGASPDLLDINNPDAVEAAVKQYLPTAEVLETFGYDWNLDPWSKGTWCMYPKGMLTTALAELQRPEGNIHFANADIADGWRGFIDGAIESGAQVAQSIHTKLGVNTA